MVAKGVGQLALGLVVAGFVLAAACSEDEDGGGGSDAAVGTDGAAADEELDIDVTLVSVLEQDDSNPIAKPHEVYLYDSATGDPVPGFEDPLMTDRGTGEFQVRGVPDGLFVTLHVVGNSEAADPTYDTLSLNTPEGTGETLLRVGISGLKDVALATGGFTTEQSTASLAGAVYWTPGGVGNERRGTIGCVEVFIDDKTTSTDETTDQRYIGDTGLPVPLEAQAKTNTSGRYYFGNLEKGPHRVRVSMDGGETFLAETEFQIDYANEDAIGEDKTVLYLLGVDVDLPENPTPDSCQGVY